MPIIIKTIVKIIIKIIIKINLKQIKLTPKITIIIILMDLINLIFKGSMIYLKDLV